MGGDFGPRVTVPASVLALNKLEGTRALLVGDAEQIEEALRPVADGLTDRIDIVPASEVVEMSDSPAAALRSKKDSSMRVALDLVKAGAADACVSAGNTGALMAISRFVLKTIESVDRPAIMSSLPTRNGETLMLDLGANVECDSEQLYQYAVMGSSFYKALYQHESPAVALLNIGEEEVKGNDRIKQANEILRSDDSINYVGYVEGNDILTGRVQVIVCDGFTGNVALKSIEGAARLFVDELKALFQRSWYSRLIGLLALPLVKTVLSRFNPGKYNGATLAGLNGVVIKSHGAATREEYAQAIMLAAREVENTVPSRLEKLL